jgi:hypothetical protein
MMEGGIVGNKGPVRRGGGLTIRELESLSDAHSLSIII